MAARYLKAGLNKTGFSSGRTWFMTARPSSMILPLSEGFRIQFYL